MSTVLGVFLALLGSLLDSLPIFCLILRANLIGTSLEHNGLTLGTRLTPWLCDTRGFNPILGDFTLFLAHFYYSFTIFVPIEVHKEQPWFSQIDKNMQVSPAAKNNLETSV